jgi:serine/threonine protein kinase
MSVAQQSARFCTACGSRAAPQALFCVDCGARLLSSTRHARTPRPAGVRVGGRYRLRRLIDMGGNGAVYEAQHELLGTSHALKETLAADPASVEQFLAEARLLARLDHPVLVRVTDYFIEPSGATFLVMEYVAGETLQHKLERAGASYSVADVVGWLLQLCSGLEYLHSYRDSATGQLRPVIHRDVKPLNVVLTPAGRIKLLDMGIAHFAAPNQATAQVARAVTEPFAPIEQYGAGTDARSDLYALGVTAYVLLTRQLPPSAPLRVASPQELRVRAVNRAVPPGVAAAIERAMMPRREARFPTVEAFRRALESGWVADDRLDGAAGQDTSGLWGTIRRVLVGPAPASGAPPTPAPAGNLMLAERLVEWRSRPHASASLEVILSLERGMSGPAQLRLAAEICQRGRRGRLSQQRITLEERDARAFAARLGELTRLGARLSGEIEFEVDRTTLRGSWAGPRSPLELEIRTSGPRGGVKSCTITLDRRQVEGLAYELESVLRRVKPAL